MAMPKVHLEACPQYEGFSGHGSFWNINRKKTSRFFFWVCNLMLISKLTK